MLISKKSLIVSLSIIKNFLKTKIKSHGVELTDFYDKKNPKVDCNHTSLALISLDSALKRDENSYMQMFLKECKYIEKRIVRHIIDDLESSSDDSDVTMKNKLRL